MDEAKQFYTALINRHIHDPERRLKVFDPNSVYLPTKKIGKNNPKEAEIEADNAARQDWNRTADMALVSGIEESKIIEIRNEHVYDEATRSVQKHGWLPGLFQGIIQKAKEILQVLIRETEIPPKPTLSVDMAEYRTMQKLKQMMSFAPSCTALEIVQPGIAGLSIAMENTSPTFSFIIMFF